MKRFARTQRLQTLQHMPRTVALAALAALALAGCHGGDDDNGSSQPTNTLPSFISGSVNTQTYDGVSDDLLTAGLGKTGLASATAPAIAKPAAPTAAELRRLAIYSNYRALVDMSSNGGYGRFWGPNVDLNGNDTLGEGKIAGKEYIAYADDGSGTQNVSLLVQIPQSFNPDQPCIVTATSSGSRGVYGAISAAGEWGLKRGCAVAYNDKGSGNGGHELSTNLVTLIDGTLANADIAGTKAIFKEAMRPWLPEGIPDRPKLGFMIPIAAWLRDDAPGLAADVLLDSRALDRGLFRDETVRALVADPVEHAYRLWTLIQLELWLRTFVDVRARGPLDLGLQLARAA